MTRFSVIGAGWRTEFFLRIARELPDLFEICGVLARKPEAAAEIRRKWGVKAVTTLDELLADRSEFVVTSVSWDSNPSLLQELAQRNIPVLSETPPARSHQDLLNLMNLLKSGARVQIAEQYSFQPEHAARISLAQSDLLGKVFQAQVSVSHGYHGISLIRRLLGLGFEPPTISARRLPEVVVGGPDRNGRPPVEHRIDMQNQLIAHLDFGEQQGVFDFVGSMYHSYIRSHRMLVRGPSGEINGNTVRYLVDFETPIEYELRRVEAGKTGNLDGLFLQGIIAGDRWVYRNPFPFARLMDDEVAIADCLLRMSEYVQGGPDFYSLAEGCQDHYLSMLMEEAADSGIEVQAELQPWASLN